MIGQKRDMMIDTTLNDPPTAPPTAPQVQEPMEEEKVFKKPPAPAPAVKMIVEPEAEAAPVRLPSPDPAPIAAPVATPPPEKKKRVASDKLKIHLAKARAKSLEVRRQKAAAKRAAMQTIPEAAAAPQARAAAPAQAAPPRAPVAMDYDKIINGVVDRMSFNNDIDDEALRLITEDIRKEETAKARTDYESKLADLERSKRQIAGKNAAVGILRGNRQPHRAFGGQGHNNNQLRGQASQNPYDKCFNW